MFRSWEFDDSRYDPPGCEWGELDDEIERVRAEAWSGLTELEKAAMAGDREKFRSLLIYENE